MDVAVNSPAFSPAQPNLIIRGGSNISPVEVEHVLISHPAAGDAAGIGVPDPELGERVAGFVQLANSDPQSVRLNEIRPYVAKRLADYKIPETLRIVDEIPRNALGKIDRKLLFTIYSKNQKLFSKDLGPDSWVPVDYAYDHENKPTS